MTAYVLDSHHGPVQTVPQRGASGSVRVRCGRASGPQWHIVACNPCEHRLARMSITRRGFPTFVPLIRVAVRDRRLGRRLVIGPAFPGYIFAEWHPAAFWQSILGQPGIARVMHEIGDRHRPIAMPDADMADLMERAHDGGIIGDASAPLPMHAAKSRWIGLSRMDAPERAALLARYLEAA